MLQLENVSKQYAARGTVQPADDAARGRNVDALLPSSLRIAKGEFVAVVGPSGSGKTTLLSILGGMLAPSTGKVLFEGESLFDVSVAQRARLRNERIGFVFQHFNLVPWLTALENVQLPLCLFGSEGDVQRVRAMKLLTQFDLADRLHHKPAQLSTGQQQRVALARTLVMDPPLILADEPTGNLDPQARQIVLDSLVAFHREGRTIVLVTHDAAAAALATRSLRIVAGRVTERLAADAASAA
jgi:putative ABC transport system ATP-binding protein